MTLIEQIRVVARVYAEARSLSLSRVSMLVFGDGTVLTRLENGADLTTRRHEAALKWFSENWPPKTQWPAGVRRPARAVA